MREQRAYTVNLGGFPMGSHLGREISSVVAGDVTFGMFPGQDQQKSTCFKHNMWYIFSRETSQLLLCFALLNIQNCNYGWDIISMSECNTSLENICL